MPPARTRDRLLDAAGTVVMREGAQALTLDAVAEEAEVSKGGLLYHFKSKRDLVEALIERWMAEFQREIDSSDPAFVRGYVTASAPEGNELGMLAALIGAPRCSSRCASRTGSGRIGSSVKVPIRSTRPSPGWLPTGSGWRSCSAWDPRPVSFGSGYSNVCWTSPNRWIDSSVNRYDCAIPIA